MDGLDADRARASLCLNDESRTAESCQQWRDCVAAPDPDDMADEDDEIDPDVTHLPAGENALTLYLRICLPLPVSSPALTGRMPDGIANTRWLPGTDDWQWDTPADGVESGLAYGRHLAGRQLAPDCWPPMTARA